MNKERQKQILIACLPGAIAGRDLRTAKDAVEQGYTYDVRGTVEIAGTLTRDLPSTSAPGRGQGARRTPSLQVWRCAGCAAALAFLRDDSARGRMYGHR
jgi:hypothetical protein